MHIVITDSSLIGEARRTAIELAALAGFDAGQQGKIGIVATEIGTNLIKHAGQGKIAIQQYSDAQGRGLEFIAFDADPGIADIPRALGDGYSTAGSPGTGLGAIKRLADHFDIYSRPGTGTALVARFSRSPEAGRSGVIIGVVTEAYPGEIENGDAWSYKERGTLRQIMVADGSGHGHAAAAAAKTAQQVFDRDGDIGSELLLSQLHRALMPTRGAAIVIAGYRPEEKQVRMAGIGNINAVLIDDTRTKHMVSHNGTVGQVAPRIREFVYPCSAPPLVLLHSDGLSAKWDFETYPGLAHAHPSLAAAVLYRDFRRLRDDATVLVVRMLP